MSVTIEQGKTLPDARGDVFRGLGAIYFPSICWLTQPLLLQVLSPNFLMVLVVCLQKW